MKKANLNDFRIFYKAILSLENVEECEAFFKDVCTIQELEAFKQRLEVAVLLNEGKSYIDINNITKASTATISRVNRCLNYGDGGYSLVVNRLKKGKND